MAHDWLSCPHCVSQELLVGLDYALPSAPVIGGLASAGALSPDRAMWAWTAEDAAAAEAEIKAAAAEAHAAAAAKAIAAATDATQRKAGRRSPDKEQDPLKAIQEAEERAENGEGMGSVGGSEEPELPTDEEVREKAARAQENGVRAARASGVWRTGACVLAIQVGCEDCFEAVKLSAARSDVFPSESWHVGWRGSLDCVQILVRATAHARLPARFARDDMSHGPPDKSVRAAPDPVPCMLCYPASMCSMYYIRAV